MSEQFPKNRKLSDAFNNSYNSNKLNHPINSSNYYEGAAKHSTYQPDNDYKATSYLNNRQDIYLDQSSILNNTYTQNANFYDEFNNQQFDHRNSQNYSDYPYVIFFCLV